jgi:hypothetical protein
VVFWGSTLSVGTVAWVVQDAVAVAPELKVRRCGVPGSFDIFWDPLPFLSAQFIPAATPLPLFEKLQEYQQSPIRIRHVR